MNEPRILCYDIETCPTLLWAFSLGEQVLRHNQLLSGYFFRPHIMSIAYQWYGEDKVHRLTWGKSEADEKAMIMAFDAIVAQADHVFGKNNNRFDNKHINFQRLYYGLDGNVDWVSRMDDLERQFRRTFYLPSQSLDYISKLLKLGGKNKMEFNDWVAMAQYRLVQLSGAKTPEIKKLLKILTGDDYTTIVKEGKAASNKMFTYGDKDVEDTMAIYHYTKAHFQPKFNHATHYGEHVCINCGSEDIVRNGTGSCGGVKYQRFLCKNQHPYHFAGKATITSTGGLGKMRS